MADLFEPGLVEMVTELERDLLARRRLYANRTFTKRLSLEKAERRLAIWAAVLAVVRERLTEAELQQLADQKDKKQHARETKRRQKAAHGMGLHA